MIRPRKLKKGDTIGLIGPCSPPVKERIKPAIKFLQSLGLNVVLGESVLKTHGFLCGSDEIRAKDINKMFASKKIDGIFIIRGGYGSSRILNLIDYETIKNNPKIFAGYSDVTALHNAFYKKCEMITYHTPMACTEFYKDVDDYTLESFKRCIFDDKPIGKLKNPDNHNGFKSLVKGEANGCLVGGNLSIVVSTMGTPYEIDTKNKILFLEEIDEAPYKVDRMLIQLKQGNKFKDAVGVILGAFTGCIAKDMRRSLSVDEVFNEIIVPEGRPVIMNVDCGHCMPTMSLPLGDNYYMNSEKQEIVHLG